MEEEAGRPFRVQPNRNDPRTGALELRGLRGGEGTSEPLPGQRLLVVTANVTVLTRERLRALLEHASHMGAQVMVLQETKHSEPLKWARKMLREQGWASVWSPPPPLKRDLGSARRLREGGTVACYRLTGEKVDKLVVEGDHRCVGLRWPGRTIWSVYGPAEGSRDWMVQQMRRVVGGEQPTYLIGDLNWRQSYKAVVASAGFELANVVPTVIGSQAAPTRALARGGHAEVIDTTEVLGIPHHCAVTYGLDQEMLHIQKPKRLRRCARYDWLREPTLDEDATLRGLWHGIDDGTLAGWRLATEAMLEEAGRMGAVQVGGKAERPKSSVHSYVPVSLAPAHHAETPVRARRVLRLHRAAVERCKQVGHSAGLSGSQKRHWEVAFRDKVVHCLPKTQADAIEVASQAYNEVEKGQQTQALREWRRTFSSKEGSEAIRAAKYWIKPSDVLDITAQQMADDWAKWWRPEDDFDGQRGRSEAQRWQEEADRVEAPVQSQREYHEITAQEFMAGMAAVMGAAGLDGWRSTEMHGLCKYAPWAIEALHARMMLLIQRRAEAADDEPLTAEEELLCSLRVVGIPKWGSEEARPIAIGNVMWRALSRALLPAWGACAQEQWCGRKCTTVSEATCHWAAAPGVAGAETDLAKAFDSVSGHTARAASQRRGLPSPLVKWYAEVAWRAGRQCEVASELSQPVRPQRGLPPGDVASPSALDAILEPWNAVVDAATGGSVATWLFMDDRSMKSRSVCEEEAERDVQTALAATEEWDKKVGVIENLKKRQVWRCGDGAAGSCSTATNEHLGLRMRGANDDEQAPAQLRDEGESAATVLGRIAGMPGGMEVRAKCIAIFAVTKWLWAAGIVELPRAEFVGKAWQALQPTQCNWWCAGRTWAERLSAHPRFATALAALKQAERLAVYGAQAAKEAARAAAEELDCHLVGYSEGEVWVVLGKAARDERLLAAVERCIPAHQRRRSGQTWAFRPTSAGALHVLRLAARAKLLASVPNRRHDVGGLGQADLDVASAAAWVKWRKLLGPTDAALLRVWRGGAASTPTRRASMAGPFGSAAWEAAARCPGCQAERASARHFFAFCPALRERRRRLAAEHGITTRWFEEAPMATAKTGWVVCDPVAGPGLQVRRALAANQMGLAVLSFLGSHGGQGGPGEGGEVASSSSSRRCAAARA